MSTNQIAPRRMGVGFCLILLVSMLTGGSGLLAQSKDKKPAEFEVLVPAETELLVDGFKTQTPGETRRFLTPSLEVGGTYSYSLKATWQEQDCRA